MPISKKGQIGDTMTWTVATVVILVLVMVFLFAVSVLAESKGIQASSAKVWHGSSSSANVQQELFALLSMRITDGRGQSIQDLLLAGEYGEQLQKAVANGLQAFEMRGITCSFFVRDVSKKGYLVRVERELVKEEVGESALLLGEKEVILKCAAR